MTDTPARTTPLAVVMDDDTKAWYREQARVHGMPTASYIRRVLGQHKKMVTYNRGRYASATGGATEKVVLMHPDPILERRNAQLQKGSDR